MDEKQKLILDVAHKCFNSHGIRYTSIEEIVKECKMSKSTFYKYFSTKENLVWEMLVFSNKTFIKIEKEIDENIEVNSRERLERRLLHLLEYCITNYSFNTQILGEFSVINGKTIVDIRNKITKNLLDSYYSSIINFYGYNVKPFIWDLIFIADSSIHEFVLCKKRNGIEIDRMLVVEFTIRQLDINIEFLKNNKNLIDKKQIYISTINEESEECKLVEKRFFEILDELKIEVKCNSNKKLYEATLKIEEEGKEKKYKSLIMDAMIGYLEKEDSIKQKVYILNNLRDNLGDDKVNV